MNRGFDRLRPRTPSVTGLGPGDYEAPHDAAGKRALFSAGDVLPAAGAVSIDCSACGERTALSPARALRAALPSVHLPVLRRDYPSWMRCPACTRRTWVRVGLHL
ncbi:MAG TPA: hypothetical protein VNG13_02415 [Mycobacteriales bacterium]|nr:hypothetical protein [Mycobacteriales bacterium]